MAPEELLRDLGNYGELIFVSLLYYLKYCYLLLYHLN